VVTDRDGRRGCAAVRPTLRGMLHRLWSPANVKPQNRQGARPHHSAVAAAAGGSGDRVSQGRRHVALAPLKFGVRVQRVEPHRGPDVSVSLKPPINFLDHGARRDENLRDVSSRLRESSINLRNRGTRWLDAWRLSDSSPNVATRCEDGSSTGCPRTAVGAERVYDEILDWL
jgi:hypothetical protein